jgi:copper chaperone CopZ
MVTSKRQGELRGGCPSCGSKGREVKPVTIESLVSEGGRARVGRIDGFRFCAEPSCEVAYFHPETRARILRGEVRVRIGDKETGSPRPICYCFEHTVEEIEAEVAETGTSRIADDITEKCRRGLDRCEETNPQGSCCLGNVRRAIHEALARRGSPSNAAAGAPAGIRVPACCATDPGALGPQATARHRSVSLWATGGAVLSAVLSSACCWLPLLLLAFGASAVGFSGMLKAYRPFFLVGAGGLLALGFYLVYFRRENCVQGSTCATLSTKVARINKVMLWVAAAVVLAFGSFPRYVGYLLGGGDQPARSAVTSGPSRFYHIEGMTCEACAANLKAMLGGLPGVARAEVSYGAKTARLVLDHAGTPPSDADVQKVIEGAGYRAISTSPEGDLKAGLDANAEEGFERSVGQQSKE